MIDTTIKLVTFIPWILYFVQIMFYRTNVMESNGLDGDKYLKYINKNLFNSINLKELYLYFLFIIFMLYNKILVLEIFFAAVYVYLLINFFMTHAKECRKIKHKGIMVQTVLLIVAIVLYFLLTDNLNITYNLMFFASIMSCMLIYLFSLMYKKK